MFFCRKYQHKELSSFWTDPTEPSFLLQFFFTCEREKDIFSRLKHSQGIKFPCFSLSLSLSLPLLCLPPSNNGTKKKREIVCLRICETQTKHGRKILSHSRTLLCLCDIFKRAAPFKPLFFRCVLNAELNTFFPWNKVTVGVSRTLQFSHRCIAVVLQRTPSFSPIFFSLPIFFF